jgi:hypothetical protein
MHKVAFVVVAATLILAGLGGWYVSKAQPRTDSADREYYYRQVVGQPYPEDRALPAISLQGDFSSLPISILMKKALNQAIANIGGPTDLVRAIDGLSGQKYRTFINNLVKYHPDPRYLEIGSYTGSTATAAISGNVVKVTCIDNWSELGGPKATFFANIEAARSPGLDFRFIESDFGGVDYASLGRFNIYLFDGPHEEQDQYDGIMIVRPALDQPFVLIVDDWNYSQVRIGTLRAIRDAGYSLVSSVEIRTTHDGSHPSVYGKNSDWHNGYFIAVVK